MHSSRRQGKKRKEMQCVAAHNSSFILRPACAEVFFFHIHGNNGEAILVSILQQQRTEEATPALALLLTVAATVRYLTKLSPTEVEIFFPHIHVSLGFTVHTRESECGQTGGEKKQERKKKRESVVFGQTGAAMARRKPFAESLRPFFQPLIVAPSLTQVTCARTLPSFSLTPSEMWRRARKHAKGRQRSGDRTQE